MTTERFASFDGTGLACLRWPATHGGDHLAAVAHPDFLSTVSTFLAEPA